MDRWASAIDTAWLQLGTETNRMVVHGIVVVTGDLDLDVLRQRVADRWVAHYPGLRQRPTWPNGPLGPARWVDAAPDLAAHIRPAELEGPVDDAAVERFVGELMSRPLPADRPWWALHLVRGYRGSATAVVVSIHHGLADGVALNHLFHALADDAPDEDEGTRTVYAAAPERRHGMRDLRLIGRSLPRRAVDLGQVLWRWPTSTGREDLAATVRGIGASQAVLTRPRAEADTALQGTLGTAKSARWTPPVPLDRIRSAGRRQGATVNDVLCAVVAGAIREYLTDADRADGTPPAAVPKLRAVMPTNLRPLDQRISHWLGNEFGLVLPTLPTDEPDPDRRVQRMHTTMDRVKRTSQALIIFAAIATAGLGRPEWTRALVAQYAATATLIITNVPGPTRELEIAGHRVEDLVFWVPCSGRLALGISILSYGGRVRLGVAADTAVLGGEDDVDRFAAILDRAQTAL